MYALKYKDSKEYLYTIPYEIEEPIPKLVFIDLSKEIEKMEFMKKLYNFFV